MNKAFPAILVLLLTVACIIRNAVWENDATLWLDATSKVPLKARGYNEIGLHYVANHEFMKAFNPLLLSLRLNPYQPKVYINLGLAYEGVGALDKAIQAYEQALSLAPDDPTPYYNLGHLYYTKKQDRGKALSFLRLALERNPREPDVHYYLSKIYQDTGQDDLAQEELRWYSTLK